MYVRSRSSRRMTKAALFAAFIFTTLFLSCGFVFTVLGPAVYSTGAY